jgi:ketosteroid isomerase-like protein
MRQRSRLLVLVLLAAGSIPAVLQAQQLSPAQQQVWDREMTYWKLWKAGDLEGFMALWDDSFVGWPQSTPVPVDRATLRAMAEQQFEFVRAGDFEYELEPLAVSVLGDVAVTFYTVHTSYSAEGRQATGESRLTHTWLRRDGTWRIVGGMSAPPAAVDSAGGG